MSEWRTVQTVPTPDAPATKAALKTAQDAHAAALKPATDALSKWRAQQDRIDRSHVTAAPVPRSEYRLKPSKDGASVEVQFRQIG